MLSFPGSECSTCLRGSSSEDSLLPGLHCLLQSLLGACIWKLGLPGANNVDIGMSALPRIEVLGELEPKPGKRVLGAALSLLGTSHTCSPHPPSPVQFPLGLFLGCLLRISLPQEEMTQ